MIQYALKCSNDHRFDSWFQSAEAFDKLQAVGMINCSHCGSSEVEKAIMAPRVQSGRKAAARQEAARQEAAAQETIHPDAAAQPEPAPSAPAAQAAQATPALSQPEDAQQQALAELKRQVEANSEYVGDTFTAEARAMHLGEAPERPIHGEARLDQAKELIEDGIPVLPLPFRPGRKTS